MGSAILHVPALEARLVLSWHSLLWSCSFWAVFCALHLGSIALRYCLQSHMDLFRHAVAYATERYHY